MNRPLLFSKVLQLAGAVALCLCHISCVTRKQPSRPVVLHQQEAGLTLTEEDANKEITVPAGQTVTIRLSENAAATGYRWEELSGLVPGGVIARVGSPNISRSDASSGMVGAPGTLTQTYFARHPGRHQIRWARIPPGQDREAEPETVTFNVVVQ